MMESQDLSPTITAVTSGQPPIAWEAAADGLCASVVSAAPRAVQALVDSVYEGLLHSVQDYLRENVDYNLSSELAQAKRAVVVAKEALNRAWASVNALGAPDTACRTDEDLAYCRAIGDALAEIEKLGGVPS